MSEQTTQAIYNFIIAFKKDNDGNSPTLREIARAAGISSSEATLYHLRKLERRGLIKRLPEKSRGIKVIGAEWVAPVAEA